MCLFAGDRGEPVVGLGPPLFSVGLAGGNVCTLSTEPVDARDNELMSSLVRGESSRSTAPGGSVIST